DDDVVLTVRTRDDSLVERPRHERDRAMPTGRRVAGVMEEDDAEVCACVVRLDDEAAVHVRMPARLVDEEAPPVVEPVVRISALVEDRGAAWRLDSLRDDPEGLPRCVVVDRSDLHGSRLLSD